MAGVGGWQTTFLNAVKPHVSDWSSIDLKVVAQKHADGQWHFSGIRAILGSWPKDQLTRHDLPSVPGLLVFHERWGVERLGEVVESVSKGELLVGGKAVHITWWNGQQWSPIVSVDHGFWERRNCRSEFGVDYASFLVRIWTQSPTDPEQLRLIEGALRSGDPPWDGQADLKEGFLGSPKHRAWQAGIATMEIIAPLGIRLSQISEVNGKRLSTSVEALERVDLSKATLGVIATLSNGETRRELHKLSSNGGRRFLVDMPPATSKTKLILSYRGIEVDRSELSPVTNPRLAVMQQLGIDLETIQSSIVQSQGHELEQWYSILLHLLGFSPALYGGTKRNVPDIVAFPGSEDWLLVIECTEAEPDVANKLTKLSTRTKLAREGAGTMNVYPVLITLMARKMLNQTDLEKASKERISILTANDLTDLLQMTKEVPEPRRVLDYLNGRIPSTSLSGGYV